MEVVPIHPSHHEFIETLMREHFGSTRLVSLGRLHDTQSLPGYVALLEGTPAGFLVFDVWGSDCELIAIASAIAHRGVGRALVDHLVASLGPDVVRVVLVTTNDNVSAQAFYEALGFSLVRVHAGAVTRARELKPEIPLVGESGEAIEDELEYELTVHT